MFKIILLITLFISNIYASEKPNLLIYCGITMVKPISEIAKIIEKKHNCNIQISQGGSQDLYDSLKYSKKGDLYLPGSAKYIKENQKDGLFLESADIGYNQAAIFVKKGNPKNINALEDFASGDFFVAIGNPDSGSIGKETKNIFTKFKNEDYYYKVYDKSAVISTDSRKLNELLKNENIDTTINWKATSLWDENIKYIDVIKIDEKYAPKKRLLLTMLKSTNNKKISKAFIDFANSTQGKEIMKKYGFND